MSFTTYSVIDGDTFEDIARKVYGTELQAERLRQANPGVGDVLSQGLRLLAPQNPFAPAQQLGSPQSNEQDQVSIFVGNENLTIWDRITITRRLDSLDTFALSAPNNPKLRPLSYEPTAISVGSVPLFTGWLVDVTPQVQANRNTDEVSGYSLPGLLNDCMMPSTAYPIEYNEQPLALIAQNVLNPFSLAAQFEEVEATPFEFVSLDVTDRVLPWLTKLAQQRKLVIGSTPLGQLAFRRPAKGVPVAKLTEGTSPLTSISPQFDPQRYYSSVTGVQPALVGLPGQTYTVRNPFAGVAPRPYVYQVDDVIEGDVKAAVETKAALMFAKAATYRVVVNTWRTPAGQLWEPGDTVQLGAPSAKVDSAYDFLIRSVSFTASRSGRTAELELIIPEAFSGEIPSEVPWS